MRFMVIVKASKDSEAGVMPSTELLTAMGKFNEELVKAGVMEAGEGLHPTAKGARIKYGSGQGSVSRGPFALSGDLVAGFWLINTKSLDEAIEWMKRAPFAGGDEIEIRQVFAAEDFGEASPPNCASRKSGCAPRRSAADHRIASHPDMTANKDTHHAIHDADDPPRL